MYDFVAIGDIVTDVFIKLDDPRIHIEEKEGKYELSLPFAEKVPVDEIHTVYAVGNAPNAATSAAKLGLKSAIFGKLGNDNLGEQSIETFKKNGVSTDLVSKEEGKNSNCSYVLWFKDDRTILRKHENFSYTMLDIGSPKLVYVSSINVSAYPFHNEVAEYLESRPEVKLAFQPGIEMQLGTEKLKKLYERTDIFFCNVEEAGRILGIETLGINELLKRVRDLGPKTVVVTDGPRGAYAYDGTNIYLQTPYPDPKPPLERTGAGDSFSSTTAIALLTLGKDLPTALKWGAVNSMSVVQHVGGQEGLLSQEQVEGYLAKAPAGFETKKLT